MRNSLCPVAKSKVSLFIQQFAVMCLIQSVKHRLDVKSFTLSLPNLMTSDKFPQVHVALDVQTMGTLNDSGQGGKPFFFSSKNAAP